MSEKEPDVRKEKKRDNSEVKNPILTDRKWKKKKKQKTKHGALTRACTYCRRTRAGRSGNMVPPCRMSRPPT